MTNFFQILKVAAVMAAMVDGQYFTSVEEAFNPGEERGSFDLIMDPYAIPAETTTYVDFVFNLPDDLPDLFHVTYGEIINSQPDHLHHFVLLGCPDKVDASQGNVPIDVGKMMEAPCMSVIGGWAPGADIFGNTDLDTGILLGRSLGIQSLQMNVHYTDGVYADEAQTLLKMATDGIRVHYTPAFRPYSSVSKQLINVITAPRRLQVPPGEPRFFVSRTCEVESACKDAGAETLGMVASFLGVGQSDTEAALGGAALTCATLAPFCGVGGAVGSSVRQLCPAACGLCAPGDNGSVNPFNPAAYRVTAVWLVASSTQPQQDFRRACHLTCHSNLRYHAHLLGREMYTTLIRGREEAAPQDQETSEVLSEPAPLTQDLQSRDFWIFDNQETIPLDLTFVQNDTVLRGTEIRPGDKLQSTCVFDSTHRTEPTNFYLSTYDEMCANSIRVTFATPPALVRGDADAALDVATQLRLLSFRCADGPAADVFAGTLGAEEDARDIWRDHPVDKVEGCTFPTADFLLGALTEETRNCDPADAGELICDKGVEFLAEVHAGHHCDGGTRNDEGSTDGLTETDCVGGGGAYKPYTCEDAHNWLAFEATLDPAAMAELINQGWGDKCCAGAATTAIVVNDAGPAAVAPGEDVADAGEASGAATVATKKDDEMNLGSSADRCGTVAVSAAVSASVAIATLLWG